MYISGVSLSLCAGGQWGFQPGIFVFLMKESMKRRRKEPDKFMAKSCSQPVNLPGAQPLMNPLISMSIFIWIKLLSCHHYICNICNNAYITIFAIFLFFLSFYLVTESCLFRSQY